MNYAKVIYAYLNEKIGNPIGVCALIGNLYAESGLKPTNMQNCYEGKFNDETYTSAVDDGSYDNFINDAIGYGLAQWTYWSRKQGLLETARLYQLSVGDISVQLVYLWKELSTKYPTVLRALTNATDIRTASDVVVKQFERPANMNKESCLKTRASYGEKFYKELVANTQSEDVYTVVKGDTLWGISKKFLGSGLKWRTIYDYNKLTSTTIEIGQKLYIPRKEN